MSKGLWVVALATAAVLCPASAQAAPFGAPFATVSVSCPSNGSGTTTYASPLTARHSVVLAKVRSVNGTGSVTPFVADGGWTIAVASGDVRWTNLSSAAVNDTVSARMTGCGASGGSAVVEFYDRPDAPATFADLAITPGLSGWPDTLELNVPSSARMVADVTLSQGAIELCRASSQFDCVTAASTTTIPLNTVEAGAREIGVRALDGPQARFSVTFRPLPVALGEVKFDRAFLAPGSPAKLSYEPDGQTTVSAAITGPAGQVVRQLAPALAVQPGSRSLTWDGKDAAGQNVADGVYTATLSSTDPYGGSSVGQPAALTVDGTGPQIVAAAPAAAQAPVTVTLTDASEVDPYRSTVIVTDPKGSRVYDSSEPVSATTQMSKVIRAPSTGWTLGARYTITVAAEDRLGNRSAAVQAFAVPAPRPPKAATGGGATPSASLAQSRSVATLRSALRKRLRGLELSRATCKRRSALRFNCSFRGKAGRRTVSGSGQVFQARAGGRVQTDLKVKVGGRKARRWRT